MKAYSQGEKEHLLMTVFECLPLTERIALKKAKRGDFAFEFLNDTGDPCLYRIIVKGQEVGAVRYYRGRKLCPMVALFTI